MYNLLTTSELTVLQSMLYEGTEDAYGLVGLKRDQPPWAADYVPLHCELAHLFLEAGSELVDRLNQRRRAA